MAAITPTNVNRVSLGSKTLVIADFSTSSDGDTWASGIGAVAGFWGQTNDNPTTQASVGVGATFSSGTFTFYPAEDLMPITFFVII